MKGDRGIALLNALIMVAAISAVAAGLMLRAETSRVRVEYLQISQQAALHLDAAEFLIDPVLRAVWERDQNLDHLQEGWAQRVASVFQRDQDIKNERVFDLGSLSSGVDVGKRQR